ncbi:uncharacterized protein LODBEIA_P61200 [Lodderomyces beijingensis]|uniref:protein disulfide-isomerase n=1 Tax=Lodderomyces beijingensis TaxID=1775926 RepID=A0ABP0ZWC5_9ASCO
MQFWKYSTSALATLLAVVSITQAGGPADGEAAADPNSAVVKLTSENFASFLEENPLVLTEFFAPWCGYCKILGPEFSKAADALNESYPKIKLAQVDCTTEEALCMEHEIRGYPTLKIIRDGDSKKAEDYQGPREHEGIVDHMIKQSLPAVQVPESWDDLEKLVEEQTKPFVLQVNSAADDIFNKVANLKRKNFAFIDVDKEYLKQLGEKLGKDLQKAEYLVVHPKQLADAAVYEGKAELEKLSEWIDVETVPYFGDIDRDTYMSYMSSPLPIAYYFYKTPEEREAVSESLSKLGKKYRGKLNVVGLDANLFGRHAEAINMNPDILPLFAIQHIEENKKYGVNQTEHPEGPSVEVIEQFVDDFFNGKLTPIIKSEPVPTAEEIAANPVVKLVAHNYNDIMNKTGKDIFVKYYAPWCGHCKKLAPTWEELAEIYGSNTDDAEVIIADIDHTANDVDVPYEIQGYPTLLIFPANGEVDEKTGIRKPIVFEGQRELQALLDFVKEKGALKVDGSELQAKLKKEAGEKVEDVKEDAENLKEEVEHDEL